MSDRKPAKDARSHILEDLQPVRPLGAPWKRLAFLYIPCTAAFMAILVLGLGLRPDIDEVGAVWSWCGSGLFIAISFAIAIFAVRESIPAAGVPKVYTLGLFIMTLLAQLALASALHDHHPHHVAEGEDLRMAVVCSVFIFAISLPWVFLLVRMIRRGMPPRNVRVLVLAGGAAVVAGEAVWRLHCPYTSPAHLLLAHFPPYVMAFALLLFLIRLKKN